MLRSYIESRQSTWQLGKDYVYQRGALAAVATSTTRFFPLDHLGTPRLVTGSGKRRSRSTITIRSGWRRRGPADSERMKFTGEERDLMGTTGQTDHLDNMHARYGNQHRWSLSADPIRGDPHSPQSFNLFAYVQGSPVVFVDPFGLQALNGISGGTSFDLFFDANPYQAWFANPANYTQVLPSVYPTGWWGPMDSYWGWQHANWWSAPYAFGSSPVASSGWAPGGTSSVPTNSALAGGSLPPISGMPGPVPINVSYSVELQFTLSLGFFKSWTGLALPIPAVIAGGFSLTRNGIDFQGAVQAGGGSSIIFGPAVTFQSGAPGIGAGFGGSAYFAEEGFAGGITALAYSRTQAMVQFIGGFGLGIAGKSPLYTTPPWTWHVWP